MAKARILVTRPEPQQRALCSALEARGYQPVSCPLLTIEPLEIDSPDQSATRQQFLNLDLYSVIVFVSRNAARLGAQLIDQYWPQLPVGILWLAIGRGTQNELKAWNIDAQVNPGNDSESLLDLDQLQHLSGHRILIVKGIGGRTLLERELTARGGRVDLAELYQRVPRHVDETELANLRADSVLLTSGAALDQFAQLAKKTITLAGARLILPSQRLVDQAKNLGFEHTDLSRGADDDAMIEALEALYT